MNNRDDFSVAIRSKARVCGRSFAGIAGSNLAGGIDVCLFCEYCVLSGRGLCEWAVQSCREVLPSVMCFQCDREASTVRRPLHTKK
jgi:hypothetical protein